MLEGDRIDRFLEGVPKERKTRPRGENYQYNVRIPGDLMDRVEDAMAFDGVRNFSQFTLSSLTAKCREVEAKIELAKQTSTITKL